MFNWVCPRCGKDVPPSKTECPYCADLTVTAPPLPPVMAQPPQAMQQVPQQYSPAPQYQAPPAGWPPPQRQGAPTWLLGVAFALAFAGIFAAMYLYLNRQSSSSSATPAQQAAVANSPAAVNPLQKYVEVTGVRLVTENKKPVARFVVVNHSGAEMAGVTGKVTLLAGPSRAESTPVGTFAFLAKSLPANGSVELSAPFATQMKAYELPDWQAATAQVQITSPAP